MPAPTPVLATEDIEEHIRRQCEADAGATRVGIELEWLSRPQRDPASPTPLQAVERIAAEAVPLPAQGSVTFEPGGQLELSTRPFVDLDHAVTAATTDSGALRHAASAHGIELLACGIDPLRSPSRVVDTPRYRAMEEYFGRIDERGQRMMCTTAALQVNLGLGPSDQWRRRFQLAQDIGPLMVAVFANSPVAARRPTGFRSTRIANWLAMDPSRCQLVPVEGDLVAAWADYARRARVMLVRDGDNCVVPDAPLTFDEWARDGHPLGYPTEDDLAYHLTTLFPPVRLKGWIELRMIDSLPSPYWEVAAALAVALLTRNNPDEVADALQGTERHWIEAARAGLDHPQLAAAARNAFSLAIDAVPSTLADAVTDYRRRFVDRGRCPADDLLDARREPACS